VGVPEIKPAVLSVKPGGKMPGVPRKNWYVGWVPPEAASCISYARLTVPTGTSSWVVVIRRVAAGAVAGDASRTRNQPRVFVTVATATTEYASIRHNVFLPKTTFARLPI
jgi:hypothetical protein